MGQCGPEAVTREILEAFLQCPYKAHLLQTGASLAQSDYAVAIAAVRSEVRALAVRKLNAHKQVAMWDREIMTPGRHQPAPDVAIGPRIDVDGFRIRLDGIRKAAGASTLGDFHYEPMLFREGRTAREGDRRLLAAHAVLLSRFQGRMPSRGIVCHGATARSTQVRFPAEPRAAERLLSEVASLQDRPPRLFLNRHCGVCEFRRQCHDQAVKEDNLSLLRGLGEKRIKACARRGILTLTQLAHTFRPVRRGKRTSCERRQRYHALQALAIRDRRVYVLGSLSVPAGGSSVYLDIEGNPLEGYAYLIGIIVVDSDGGEQQHSLWADSPAEERVIFERLLDLMSQHGDATVFCYGSYEAKFLERMRRNSRRKRAVDTFAARLVNVLSVVYRSLYFPTYSNSLKDVASCLDFSWKAPDASGAQSVAWRLRWERTGDAGLKARLVDYNLDDCTALRKVTEFIRVLSSGAEQVVAGSSGPPMSTVDEFDKLAVAPKWQRNRFAHSDYDYVNDRAQFDYQRQRVFVRTSRRLRKAVRKASLHENRKLPAREIDVKASKCPDCGCKNPERLPDDVVVKGFRRKRKRSFDLALASGGIKRLIYECRPAIYQCSECGLRFTPERFQRLAKHFHGLMSWAVFQHVAHGTSGGALAAMFDEFFGLHVTRQEIHGFKALMARRYRTASERIFSRMLAGPVLHVDETEVRLRSGRAYVWVFASLEEVAFLLRPNREGAFLKDALADFKGVLVSDFYAAYDSLECPQQKCLVHLIRDINQEILSNPFDGELNDIAAQFGALLRAVVATVDEYGLKRCHLVRHTRDADAFFDVLAGYAFSSEAALTLQKRLLKSRDKLFTFVRHDGVPWNNAVAENAIKHLARYRERTAGVLTEDGLAVYLVLLGLYITCRLKGLSFLKFLLSKSRDVDAFARNPRARPRQGIEVYPKGFGPRWGGRSSERIARAAG
jgi:predicted RecB family nuclease